MGEGDRRGDKAVTPGSNRLRYKLTLRLAENILSGEESVYRSDQPVCVQSVLPLRVREIGWLVET